MTANLMRPWQPLSGSCAATKHGSIRHRRRANTKRNLSPRMAIAVVNGLAGLK